MKLDREALVKAHEKLNVMCHPELGATYDLRAAITAYLASLPQNTAHCPDCRPSLPAPSVEENLP